MKRNFWRKTISKTLITTLVVSTAASVSFSQGAKAGAETVIQIDPQQPYQQLEGWGTSLIWWADQTGGWPDAKRNAIADLVFDPDKGLGLNIARYNIGAGDDPSHNHMRLGGNIATFEPSPGVWDWTADANQRWMLQAAKARGANKFEAFSNSPPWWMTISGDSSGAADGGNNLKEDMYDDFADHMTTVVKKFRDDWGINFDYLSPLNEPISNWWKAGGLQQGAHFDLAKQNQILGLTAQSLAAKGLTATKLTGSDENSIDDAITSYTSLSPEVKAQVAKINAHSYNGDKRTALKGLADSENKSLWMSEFGTGSAAHTHESMQPAFELSTKIIQDMNLMQPTAWVVWDAVEDETQDNKENNSWGLIHADYEKQQYWLTKQYYAMAQFSKFIRPGYQLLASSDSNTLVAYDAASEKLVIVQQNQLDYDGEGYKFDLSGFQSVTGSVKAYRTSISENLAEMDEALLQGNALTTPAKRNSITTYVVSGVKVSPKKQAVTSVTKVNDNTKGTGDAQFDYSAGWGYANETGPYQSDNHYSNTPNASVSVQFTGTQVQLRGPKHNNQGIVAVSIDGGAETMVDTFSWYRQDGQLIYESPELSNGTHTIKMRVTGTKYGASSDSYFVADEVDIIKPQSEGMTTMINDNTLGSSNNEIQYMGTNWAFANETDVHYKDNHYSTTTDEYALIRFNGTRLKLYGAKANNHGKAGITLDNGTESLVDYYASTRSDNQLMYDSGALAAGPHIVKVRVTGQKNANSSGAAVAIDRVEAASEVAPALEGTLTFAAAGDGKTKVTYGTPSDNGSGAIAQPTDPTHAAAFKYLAAPDSNLLPSANIGDSTLGWTDLQTGDIVPAIEGQSVAVAMVDYDNRILKYSVGHAKVSDAATFKGLSEALFMDVPGAVQDGKTQIRLGGMKQSDNRYVYKANATAAPSVSAVTSGGWKTITDGTRQTLADGTKVGVAEVDTANKVVDFKVLQAVSKAEPALPATSGYTPIDSGKIWYDTAGRVIEAHGGGMIQVGDTYYWVGENKDGGTGIHRSINIYASKDLANWQLRNETLPASLTGNQDFGPNKVIERPKIIYNDTTQKYVMYSHIENPFYSYSRIGVATSDTVDGDYTYVNSYSPNNNMSRDSTVFKDTDGKAYLIASGSNNATLYVYRLSEDYLTVEAQVNQFTNQYRESPAVIKKDGKYVFFSSGLSGWATNQNKYIVCDTMSGPCTNNGAGWTNFGSWNTYNTQTTYVLPVTSGDNTFYMYMGDRWNGNTLDRSTYVWLPFTGSDLNFSLDWNSRWEIDPANGTWRTPQEAYTRVTGTSFGSSPAWGNSSNTYDKVFDGNAGTYFDYTNGVNGYAGMDFGAGNEKAIAKISFLPRAGYAERAYGVKIQGSNTGQDSGYEDIAQIESIPTGLWEDIYVKSPKAYRYVRYVSGDGTNANMAEMEFNIKSAAPVESAPPLLQPVTFVDAAGVLNNGKTQAILPTLADPTGSYRFKKVSASEDISAIRVGASALTGWETFPNDKLITAENGERIFIAEVNSDIQVVRVGEAQAVVIQESAPAVPVSSIKVTSTGNASTISAKGGKLQLQAAVLPANASIKAVTWAIYETDGVTLSNKATIDPNGVVTAVRNGKIKAVAAATDGSGVRAEKALTISGQPESVATINITSSNNASAITAKGGKLQLQAAVLPTKASNKAVTWAVFEEDGLTNTDKATIDQSGLLRAVKDGKVKVVATAKDGSGVRSERVITISGQPVSAVSITITGAGNASEITEKGGKLPLQAAVLPSNATNKALKWAVFESDGLTITDKATIDQNGLLTAKKNGAVKVIATAKDGSAIQEEKEITISGQVVSISSIALTSPGSASAITAKGGKLQLQAVVLPTNAANKAVTWAVFEEDGVTITDKAIIDQKGLLKAVKDGKVKVVAIAKDGSAVRGEKVITLSGQKK